jgi:beta-lactamase regulating signal transducer with metallopeptidase domain
MFSQNVITDWLSWGWPVLFNHLWQATVFAAIALAIAALMKRGSARGRYSILLLASTKFVLPSAFFVFLLGQVGIDSSKIFTPSVESPAVSQSASPLASTVNVHASAQSNGGAEPIFSRALGGLSTTPSIRHDYTALYYAATGIWLSGFILLLIRWSMRRRQLSLALRAGESTLSGREHEALCEVVSQLRIRRRVRLIISPKVLEPGVWGILHPIVVLPEGISDQLSDAELKAVMLHEMIHVMRWDNLVSNLQMILCCLFWFHPLIWLIDKRLLAEREQTCDERVIKLGGASNIYASSITKIYRFCLGWKVTGLSSIGGSNLRRRIERITANDLSVRIPVSHRLLIVAFMAVMVVVSIVAGSADNGKVSAQNKKAEETIISPEPLDAPSVAAEATLTGLDSKKAATETPATPLAQLLSEPLAQVIVRSTDSASTISPPSMQSIESAPQDVNLEQLRLIQPANAGQLPVMQTAHSVDLRKYVGRYAVDPAVMENFVFDVTYEAGGLWLKPSHAQRRRLIAKSDVDFVDETSDETYVTFNWDETGNVTSLTFRGWGQNVKVMKLVLPQPSLVGSTTFRLSGHANARIVAVAGSFNNWNQSQFLFAKIDGEWVCRIVLPPGKYEYKFIVDGNWLLDPRNSKVIHDDRGNENSVLIVE